MDRPPASVDVAVVGAGAAGIGAARRLAAASLDVLLIEARDRPGGRAHTLTGLSGTAIDLGCEWLHSADENPLVAVAEQSGLSVDRSPPPWSRPAVDIGFPPEEQQAYRAAFAALDARIDEAAKRPDQPVSELMEPGGRWNALLDAFSGFYNGAPFREVSVHDYAAYRDTELNWRVREGYGTLISGLAAGLPAVYGAPVRRIDRRGPTLKIETAQGSIEARAAILCLPTAVLAAGAVAFDPPLPDKLQAADDLPLGHVDKAFLTLEDAEAFPQDSHLFGRTDTALTASYNLRPLGRPMIEAFFGGDLADGLEREGPGAFSAFAIDELVALLGSNMRTRLKAVAETDWGVDPFTLGAYSHAKPGRRDARRILAEPVDGRLFFAGEATSPEFFSTAHGAYLSGLRAADEVLAALQP